MAHWKTKLTDVNFIGTHVLPNEQPIIVKVVNVEWAETAKVMGQNKACFLAHFAKNEYFNKPMILNKTNLKRLTKLTGTPNYEQWVNVDVTLLQEMDKAIGGGTDWALRISKDKPVLKLPVLIEGSKEWEAVLNAKDKYTIADFRKKYSISDELANKLK